MVANAPLVSIDLVVRGPDGRVLLGQRTNRPAQHCWFVPGGRIVKDESVQQAFERLLQAELGISADGMTARFRGIYQHFYDDNFSGLGFSTHYVVLAYEISLSEMPLELPDAQHCEYRWFTEQALLNEPLVHKHTRWYFLADTQADSALLR